MEEMHYIVEVDYDQITLESYKGLHVHLDGMVVRTFNDGDFFADKRNLDGWFADMKSNDPNIYMDFNYTGLWGIIGLCAGHNVNLLDIDPYE